VILYVNGDSHSAGAEAVNSCCFAEDDPLYYGLGRQPHPDNLQSSYGCDIANRLGAILHCDAESASSNDRILRTTREYLKEFTPELVIIGWATWEREEWLHNGTYYQVTASGSDSVPDSLQDQYKQWVVEQDYAAREAKMLRWHAQLWDFHNELNEAQIPHLFFNTYSDFGQIRRGQIITQVAPSEHDWGTSYLDPYNQNSTYFNWLQLNGYATVRPDSYHYGAKAHRAWAKYLFQNHMPISLPKGLDIE
jgi:hypothetical protein